MKNLFLILALLTIGLTNLASHSRINKLETQVKELSTTEYQIVCNPRKKLETIQNSVWGCMGVGQGLIKKKN